MRREFLMSLFLLSTATILTLFAGGCSAEASRNTNVAASSVPANSQTAANTSGTSIAITPNSPADTVRAFYQKLREKKFREAIFLTNLRPAVEGLTDTELKEFQVDFEVIAKHIPAEVQINGEIISGNEATVTAKLPNEDLDQVETQQIQLRKENDVWVIVTVDAAAEARIKKEGKNYFYALRIETHEDEARTMLERISKAEIAHSIQNGGVFTDIPTLVGAGFLPDDIKTSESTGYNYTVNLAENKREYYATATPAEYGKSGRLSFIMIADGKSTPRITSKDAGGKPLKK